MNTNKIAISNICLLDIPGRSLRKGYHILIQNGLIQEVSSSPFSLKDLSKIDGKGLTLMPGLIDAHVHVTAPKLDLHNDDIPESEIAIQAGIFLEQMLQRGFTSVRDAGGADFGLAHAVETGLIKGPRLFYSGKALSQTGGHGDFRKPNHGGGCCSVPCGCVLSGSSISRIADGVTEVRKAARDELRKGATQLKIMASGGVASPTDRISNLQYSEEEIKAIVEEASNFSTYVLAHAYTPAAISRCVKLGVRCIEHGNLLDEETAALMVRHGTFLVPTLVIYECLYELGPELGLPIESLQKLDTVRKQGLQAIKIARSQGVKIGFGTDLLGAEGNLWQMREFSLRSQVETPFEILESATMVNGELVMGKNKLGIIAPNAIADLLLIQGNPGEDISLLVNQPDRVKLIMKGGQVMKNTIVSSS